MSRSLDLADTLQVAIDAAEAAAVPIMELFRSPNLTAEHKGDGSPVTLADKQAERVIREILQARTPEIDLLGEEEGELDRGRRYRWIIDPIDGTISFSRGLPLFGTLLGLEDRETDEAILGVINLPALGELYAGGHGLGAHCNGQPVFIEDRPMGEGYQSEIICAGDPLWFAESGREDDHSKLTSLPLFRGYCDCFAHAMVLRGSIGATVDPGLAPWDLCASQAVVTAAGGRVFTAPSNVPGKTDAILGAPMIVEDLLERLGW